MDSVSKNKICMGKHPYFMLQAKIDLILFHFLIIKVFHFLFVDIINHTDKLAHQSALYYAARKGHT